MRSASPTDVPPYFWTMSDMHIKDSWAPEVFWGPYQCRTHGNFQERAAEGGPTREARASTAPREASQGHSSRRHCGDRRSHRYRYWRRRVHRQQTPPHDNHDVHQHHLDDHTADHHDDRRRADIIRRRDDPSPPGVFGKAPTVTVPRALHPRSMEVDNLITGKGAVARRERHRRVAVRPRDVLDAQGRPSRRGPRRRSPRR